MSKTLAFLILLSVALFVNVLLYFLMYARVREDQRRKMLVFTGIPMWFFQAVSMAGYSILIVTGFSLWGLFIVTVAAQVAHTRVARYIRRNAIRRNWVKPTGLANAVVPPGVVVVDVMFSPRGHHLYQLFSDGEAYFEYGDTDRDKDHARYLLRDGEEITIFGHRRGKDADKQFTIVNRKGEAVYRQWFNAWRPKGVPVKLGPNKYVT